MKITRLVRGVRNAHKIAIYIDSKYTFSVLDSVVIDYGLYVAKELNNEELTTIQHEAERREIKHRLETLITKRPRSEREIRQYIAKKRLNKEADGIIESLKEIGLIDDYNFANWWIDQRINFKLKSVTEIRRELINKGIKNDIIEIAFTNFELQGNEIDVIKILIEKKKRILNNKNLSSEQMNDKIMQFLLRKGFRYETILKALGK